MKYVSCRFSNGLYHKMTSSLWNALLQTSSSLEDQSTFSVPVYWQFSEEVVQIFADSVLAERKCLVTMPIFYGHITFNTIGRQTNCWSDCNWFRMYVCMYLTFYSKSIWNHSKARSYEKCGFTRRAYVTQSPAHSDDDKSEFLDRNVEKKEEKWTARLHCQFLELWSYDNRLFWPHATQHERKKISQSAVSRCDDVTLEHSKTNIRQVMAEIPPRRWQMWLKITSNGSGFAKFREAVISLM